MSDIPITRANGYLVTYAAAEQRSYELCDDLEHAHDSYSEPPMGWTSIGISACQDGVPFAALPLPRVQYVRPLSVVTAP